MTREMPPEAEFVAWLEARGARLSFRHDATTDWHLKLDGVPDMTHDEAAAIARAAFQVKEAIRDVIMRRPELRRRPTAPTVQ